MSEQTTTIDIPALFTEEHYSPYKVAKVVNSVLEAAGEKPIPPQMAYTYSKKGFLGTKDDHRITRQQAAEWAEKYLTKRLAK